MHFYFFINGIYIRVMHEYITATEKPCKSLASCDKCEHTFDIRATHSLVASIVIAGLFAQSYLHYFQTGNSPCRYTPHQTKIGS